MASDIEWLRLRASESPSYNEAKYMAEIADEIDRLRAALETAEGDTEARIVAWLRSPAARGKPIELANAEAFIADAIESGDHRKGADQ